MIHDHDVIASLEQRLLATDEQVAIMKVRADRAEERIVDYTNELAKVNNHCDAQIAEISMVLQTQRGQLDNIGFRPREQTTNSLSASLNCSEIPSSL